MRICCAAGTAVIFMMTVLCSPAAHAVCSVADDYHHLVQLKQPARRVVSLAPDITEILFAIGGGERIAGVIQGSDYPPAARQLPLVGSYQGIDLEKIISLRPDLIVVWGNSFARPLEVLKKMGVPVYVSEPRQISDVPRTMQNLGCLLGQQEKAQDAANAYNQRLARFAKQYQHVSRLRVFYQIGFPALITINKNSWISEIITLCGGVNVFADTRFPAPEVSRESVMAADPQVILSDADQAGWKTEWLKWPGISAVRNGQLFTIPADLIDRPGPRLLQGMERVCQSLQQARTLT
ncbi:Vitamin B12-binding protein [Aquicella siphonis]|uniref:Vitamin B12-binding protein n=1 Tax=Aquicella siphonis TaxID=254247 RepID=A0A5E4PFJ6_9COXI|nr:cobalamin-binding protein [Aquicella siphonis]VVC75268.1 Vitamin B12-binding protein [Aquicella siphonis]